jgi:uncharacterized protein (DUF2141 family)
VTHVKCNGESNGSICVTPHGGVPEGGIGSYYYTWEGSAVTDSCLDQLPAGVYTVTITDREWDTLEVSFTVVEPDVLSVSISESYDPLCYQSTDGSVTSLATGGTNPIVYSWNSGEATPAITGKSAGKYVVTVTDDNGCMDKDSVTLTEPDPFVLGSITEAWDTANSIGSIQIFVSGGTANYTYTLSGAGTDEVTIPETTYKFTGLSGGDYYLSMVDANGCGPLDTSVLALSIGDFHFGSGLKVYPNPSSGKFILEFKRNKTGDAMIEIVNMTGQLVYKKLYKDNRSPVFQETIDLGIGAKGNYFLRVNGQPVRAMILIE